MKIVVDTNVLIAGLLKNSIVRKILNYSWIEFFIPEIVIEEVEKYIGELCFKGNYSQEELRVVLSFLLDGMIFVKKTELEPFMKKAEKLMAIDIKDAPFIAACFAIKADGIWSFDKHFRYQSEVPVFDIEELSRMDKMFQAS